MDNKSLKATRQSYGEALEILGELNPDVVVLDADLSEATKTNLFAKKFPERFFDMGIAEQNMMGTAAGLATCGKIPYASTFAVFAAGRSYDQIRTSICYPNLNVKIVATHCGITVGEDGATHQMLEDISLMRTLPNMTVMCTSDDVQTKWAIQEMAKKQGPFYLRLCRLATPSIYQEKDYFEIGKAIQIGDGTDGTIFATGVVVPEAIKAMEMIKEKGITDPKEIAEAFRNELKNNPECQQLINKNYSMISFENTRLEADEGKLKTKYGLKKIYNRNGSYDLYLFAQENAEKLKAMKTILKRTAIGAAIGAALAAIGVGTYNHLHKS